MDWNDPNLIKKLKENGVVVMPTDTLYGIVGRAEDINTVEKIYRIKKRSPEKPCIILIGDAKELEKFSIILSETEKIVLLPYWPGPTSIIFDCPFASFSYLHRGTRTLAFRIPAPVGLRNLLREVGPLIAPSANPEGLPPAENIAKAKEYFGDDVNLYVDGGNITGVPSKVIKLQKDGTVSILRG